MGQTRKTHDPFFRGRMADPAMAAMFLRHHLPEETLRRLDLRSITSAKEVFPDLVFPDRILDNAFAIDLVDGGRRVALVLFEHKSKSEPAVGLQLLRYMVRIWDYAARLEKRRPLPLILPVIVYNGRERWRRGTELFALSGTPKVFAPHVPRFSCFVTDLGSLKDEEIVGPPRLRIVLLALRHVFDEDLPDRLPKIFGALGVGVLGPKRSEALGEVIKYLEIASDVVGEKELTEAVEAAFPGQGGRIMGSYSLELLEKGRREGRSEGRKEGVVSTTTEMVVEALKTRFEKVPRTVVARIKALDDLRILKILHRQAITVESLKDFRSELERVEA